MTGTVDAESLAIFEHRLARKLKLLPKLRYPNGEESKKLAELAELFDPARVNDFASHIQSIIFDAHLNFSRRGFSAEGVRNKLRGIGIQAKKLSGDLRSIDLGSGKSAERAGLPLELEFRKIELPELIDLFQTLGEAAQRAAAKPQRAREKLALKILVQNLFMAARQRSGYSAMSRAAKGNFRGPLLDALEILKKYLPKEMFPGGRINGRSIEYIYEKLPKRHTTKNMPSES